MVFAWAATEEEASAAVVLHCHLSRTKPGRPGAYYVTPSWSEQGISACLEDMRRRFCVDETSEGG